MIDDSVLRHFNGAQQAITVALWHIQQLENAAPRMQCETAMKQVRYTICAADTVLQLGVDAFDDGEEDEADDEDDDDDEPDDPVPVGGGGEALDKEA